MRSLAELVALRRLRRGIEWALRAVLIAALLVSIREALTTMRKLPSLGARGGEGALRSALRDWSTVSSRRGAHLQFDSTPSAATRDWAAALPGASTPLTWRSTLAPVGLSVEPIADPKGASRIWIAAPSKSRLALADSLGVMDSVSVGSVGAVVGPVYARGHVRAMLDGSLAVAARSDSLIVRPVLVLGRAGWEPKFIAAALEEYGWKVDARLAVSPGNDVVQGSPSIAIDTSRYSAVVVTDTSASRYGAAIERYVRNGGGLIVAGEGASAPTLQRLLPAFPGDALPASEFTVAHPRNALSLRPLTRLRPGAVALEMRSARVAIAAQRVTNGRVIEIGYVDTWRWRMGGPGDPVEDHRAWWSTMVSSAAYAPRIPLPDRDATNPAPVAAIYSALGAPSKVEADIGATGSEALMLDLFIVAIAALILETASRRMDGKP